MSTIQQLKNFIRHGEFLFYANFRFVKTNNRDRRRLFPIIIFSLLTLCSYCRVFISLRLLPAPASPRHYVPTDIISFPLIGKQARTNNNDDSQRKNDTSPPNVPAAHKGMAHVTEPALGAAAQKPQHVQPIPDAYSVQPAGNGHNRVAQANDVAAHHAEQNIDAVKNKTKHAEDQHVAKLVEEERQSRSKFPRYPGLERWELIEKMGDGAFSNVYRARDTTGDAGEVAIKVVRKFEMNNLQVSLAGG